MNKVLLVCSCYAEGLADARAGAPNAPKDDA